MKKSHIIAVVVIAACIGLIVATAGDASTYVSFNQAYQMASNGNDNQIHVVGDSEKRR
jgi:cytochrome c-type biogenesis protein CcmE